MDPVLFGKTPSGKKRKNNTSSSDSDTETNDNRISSADTLPPQTQYFIVEPEEGKSLTHITPFAIEKSLLCQVGNVLETRKLRSGSILVRVASQAQANLIINIKTILDINVAATPHRTLNSCRGIIRCRDLRDCDDTEVLHELQPQGVTAVHHILATRNGIKEPTNTFVLTFNTPTLPTTIKVGYLRVHTEQYVPNPLRCYQCQRYGHGKNACKRPVACARCGQEGHTDSDCSADHHCVNCRGDHPAYSKECAEWKKQKDITTVKYKQNVSFREAADIVRVQSGSTATNSKPSYAQTARGPAPTQRSTSSTATQTMLTWPLDSKVPLSVENLPIGNQPMPQCSSHSQTESMDEPIIGAVGGKTSPSLAPPVPPPKSAKQNITVSPSSNKNRPNNPNNNTNSNKIQQSTVSKNKNQSTRPQKGDDPIKLHNQFSDLTQDGEYQMEVESRSGPGHNKPTAKNK